VLRGGGHTHVGRFLLSPGSPSGFWPVVLRAPHRAEQTEHRSKRHGRWGNSFEKGGPLRRTEAYSTAFLRKREKVRSPRAGGKKGLLKPSFSDRVLEKDGIFREKKDRPEKKRPLKGKVLGCPIRTSPRVAKMKVLFSGKKHAEIKPTTGTEGKTNQKNSTVKAVLQARERNFGVKTDFDGDLSNSCEETPRGRTRALPVAFGELPVGGGWTFRGFPDGLRLQGGTGGREGGVLLPGEESEKGRKKKRP